MTPRSPIRMFGGHCDRYAVTRWQSVASAVASAPPERATGAATKRQKAGYRVPSYHPATINRCPADRESTSAPGSSGPGFPRQTAHFPSVDAVALRSAPREPTRLRRTTVIYVDRTLACVDCGVEFIHSAADQEYYTQKGFVSDPKRCTSCRASRRAVRDGGSDVRDIGGPRGYERGDDRPNREYFAVLCSSCGNQAQVPFKPRMDRPVYCSDCFRTVRPD